MPAKHIDENTWEKIKNEHVRAVVLTKASLKDTEVMKLLIKVGLENVKDEHYIKLAAEKHAT